MADVDRLPSGRWQARWRDPDGKQRKASFRVKAEAVRHLAAVEHSRSTGTYLDDRAGRITVSEWAERWFSGRGHLKPKTVAGYRGLLDVHVLPRWGRVPLAKVRHADVVTWLSELRATGLSASRVRQAHHVLRAVLASAVKDGRIGRNAADDIDLPRLPTTDRRYLTHAQVAALADACGDSGLLVRVLAYTGLRWGEATALRVRSVDVLRGRLAVVEAVTEVSGHVHLGTPKSHAHRTVPVPRFLRDELAAHLAGREPDALVFASPRGAYLRNSNWRNRVFDAAAASVGLEGLTPHELRHTAASLAIGAGATVKGVQAMLGHASAAMTLDVYGHLMGDELDAVAERLDAAAADVPAMRPAASVVPLPMRRTTS